MTEEQETASDYADKVRDAEHAYPCKHGHIDCAAWERGPCVDEVLLGMNEEDKA